MRLNVGTAVADITPDIGSIMGCFPEKKDQPRVSTHANDPIQAKCLSIADGATTIVLCTLDVCMIRESDIAIIRDQLEKRRPDIPRQNIIIAATHTHSTPETGYLFGATPDSDYSAFMIRAVVNTIERSLNSKVPASLAARQQALLLNHNRRARGTDGKMTMIFDYDPDVTTGPCDNDLTVLTFANEDDEPIAVLSNFAAHPLTVGPGNTFFSADFPGVANALIENELTSATAFFTNAAAGNVHPRKSMKSGTDTMMEIGTQYGHAVLDTALTAAEQKDPTISLKSTSLSFTNRMDESLTVDVELTVIHIGDICMAIVPGEYFVEFQIAFKKAVKSRIACIVGYANGWPGYIPTDAAYAEGGYGVDACTTDPPALSRTALPKGAGERILEALIKLKE